jgi:excisionase family DNA binding protein
MGLKRVHDLSHLLNCSQETVRRMLRTGKVPGIRVGRDWRADPAAVMLALSNNCAINTTIDKGR